MVGLGLEAIFLFPSFKCWDTSALEIAFLSRDHSQDGALYSVVSLLFERGGGGREGQGNRRRTRSSGCDREGMNGHEWVCFPWGTKAAVLQITHSCSLLWRKRAHANEVISSLNYEKYTVDRRKVKSKRRWHLEGPDTRAPMLTRIIKT